MRVSPRSALAIMLSHAVPIGSKVVPFWGLPYRILNMIHKQELLMRLWVATIPDPTLNL